MRWVRLVCATSIGLASACADPPPSEPTDPVGSGSTSRGSSDTATADETATSDGLPRVIDVGQDVLVLREGESVVLTAVVVDDDDDVVGGELLGPGQPPSYGSFTAHQSDRWRATVAWDEVQQRSSLSFSQEIELPFTVRFTDAQGHVAEDTITLRAVCSGLVDTACDGECVDLQADSEHCGGCGSSCRLGPALDGIDPSGGCQWSECRPWWTECIAARPGARAQSCAEHCAHRGARCVADGCPGVDSASGTRMLYADLGTCERDVATPPDESSCAQIPDSWAPPAALRCCCL